MKYRAILRRSESLYYVFVANEEKAEKISEAVIDGWADALGQIRFENIHQGPREILESFELEFPGVKKRVNKEGAGIPWACLGYSINYKIIPLAFFHYFGV